MILPDGSYLIDTSMLIRIDQPTSPVRQSAMEALEALEKSANPVYIAPQNLFEFWNVATRPLDKNGLGMLPSQAATRVRALRNQFGVLPDVPAIYPAWERLAEIAQVSGKQVHDTRLAAFMLVHGLTHILTLNAKDFRRFEPLAGITVIEPSI